MYPLPTVDHLWWEAKLGHLGSLESVRVVKEYNDPGVHRTERHGLGDRVTVVTPPDWDSRSGGPSNGTEDLCSRGGEERILHLIQDEETVADIHHCVVPPDEYYEELALLWKK